VFICGVTQIKEFYVICQFPLEKSPLNVDPPQLLLKTLGKEEKDKKPFDHSRTPDICVYRGQSECLMKDNLDLFSPIFTEVHYKLTYFTGRFDG
jgi:hypothetical protein